MGLRVDKQYYAKEVDCQLVPDKRLDCMRLLSAALVHLDGLKSFFVCFRFLKENLFLKSHVKEMFFLS